MRNAPSVFLSTRSMAPEQPEQVITCDLVVVSFPGHRDRSTARAHDVVAVGGLFRAEWGTKWSAWQAVADLSEPSYVPPTSLALSRAGCFGEWGKRTELAFVALIARRAAPPSTRFPSRYYPLTLLAQQCFRLDAGHSSLALLGRSHLLDSGRA